MLGIHVPWTLAAAELQFLVDAGRAGLEIEQPFLHGVLHHNELQELHLRAVGSTGSYRTQQRLQQAPDPCQA